MSPLHGRLTRHPRPADPAIVDDDGRAVTYAQLLARAGALAGSLLGAADNLGGQPVAFLAPPSAAYVEALLGIVLAGGTAVPLSPLHTAAELGHVLDDAQPCRVLASAALVDRLRASAGARPVEALPPAGAPATPARIATVLPEQPALMLYTSGTTGRPKGVVHDHAAVAAALSTLEQAWGWRRDDRLLHVLPLHHTHGVVVALLGALWAGARVRFATFAADRVWDLLADATVFMAVPTIYAKLVDAFSATPARQAAWRAAAAGLRLATSGSAALPAPLFRAFETLTGQRLLERYGMTEIGMALSNPLAGARLPGTVGRELPGVVVEITDESGQPVPPGEPGELRVRSPQMFSRYHRDPEATARAFDADDRFLTGDTAVREPTGAIRLLGRTSVDILKSGGYKLSALEIEDALRDHPAIADLAVVGLPDETWGDRITAFVVPHPGTALTLEALQTHARDRLAPYKLPRDLRLVDALPRNAMGKVMKTLLKSQ